MGKNASFGRMKVIAFAGNQIGQVFVEAGLADGTDDDVVAFWDAMAARARGQKNHRLTAIGRQGERLTIDHEEGRTGRKPKWMAIDNNEDGYDVLSIVDTEDPRSLSIEVKSSTMGLSGVFHLSRNESDRAEETENHSFHLWDMHPNHPRVWRFFLRKIWKLTFHWIKARASGRAPRYPSKFSRTVLSQRLLRRISMVSRESKGRAIEDD